MINIGIDPGRKTGYAEAVSWGKLLYIDTISFWDAVYRIDGHKRIGNKINVFIEAPGDNRAVWTAKSAITEAIRKNKNIHYAIDIALKISKNIGQNIEQSELLIEYCKKEDIPVTSCRPNERSMTKLTHKEFVRLTGLTNKTSEHSRDAFMLIWGR